MILKKRGFLIVVVLVILLSFSGLAGWNNHCPTEQCVSIVVGVTGCPLCDDGVIPLPFIGIPGAVVPVGGPKGADAMSCNTDNDDYTPVQCQPFEPGHGDLQIMLTESEDCTFGNTNPTNQAVPGACWFIVGDKDGNPDDCGIARAAPGEKWGNGYGPWNYLGETNVINGDDDDVSDVLNSIYIEDPWEYICSDNGFWETCYADAHREKKIVANGATYECTYENGAYQWVTDRDGDGYTTSEDCDDDKSDDYVSGRGVDCSELLSPEQTVGKSVGEVREMARGACEANPGKYSHCAICINSGAAEICGDGINNDCGGPEANEDLDEDLGLTPDRCDLNQASCEQEFVGHCSESNTVCNDEGDCSEGEECRKDVTGICKPLTVVESCTNDASCGNPSDWDCNAGKCEYTTIEYCSEDLACGDPEAWLCDKATTHAFNVYNTPFDWIKIEENGAESGYCCGFGGAKDAGESRIDLDNQQSYVCLTDNDDFVSTEKDFDGNGIDEVFSTNGCEGKNWCWISAAAVNNLFKIFTIKRLGEIPFDVVSNADDWFMCDANAEKKTLPEPVLPEPGVEGEASEEEKSNRFYCYQEGNRWAWSECTGDWNKRENPSVKGRYTGEGLFTLPLSIPETDIPEDPAQESDENPNADFIRDSLIDTTITVTYKKLYSKYYGKGFLDFGDYDYLNFMVRYVKDEDENPIEQLKDLKQLPLKIKLKLVGPEVDGDPIIYFDDNVLGYVINTPFSDFTSYMHVQVPLKESYRAVQGFTISSDSDNLIQVRNIYLSSNTTNLPNQLCSGQESAAATTWIQDADAGNPDVGITGENLCKVLYGEEAWLGEDQEVSEFEPAANCCGNAKNEYYAGISKGYLPEGSSTEEFTYYGCWNSRLIASSDTVMDVEFQVESQETDYNVVYSSVDLPVVRIDYRVYDQGSIPDPADDLLKESKTEGQLKCNEDDLFPSKLEVGDTSTALCHFTLSENFEELPLEYRGITKLWFNDPLSDDLNSPVELLFYDRVTNTFFDSQINFVQTGSVRTDQDDEEFELSGPAQYLSKEELLEVWNHPLSVVARLKSSQFFTITNSTPSTNPVTQTVTYACSETECLFPLPGNPPYKSTNLHPDLYELYYVTGKLAADETPITQPEQEFPEYANLKVKRIAQQVLFYNEGEESTKDIAFYGCRAADFITNVDDENNLQYCAVLGDKFCSYSEVHEEENNKDAFTIVNTWSDEGLTHVGYADPLQTPEEGQNISAYYESVELVLKEQAKASSTRNQSTSVLPARNFIANAEFTTSATKIPFWEILLANDQAVADEKSGFVKLGENKVVLGSNQKLRSERISVPSSVDVHFSTAQECTAKILLVDKNGNSQEASLPQFNTGDASYVIVEFTGPCEVEKPMLQVVDEKGPAEYSYQPAPLPQEFANPDARSGAACCPNNYCWNGYSCVEPMGILTTVSEHIADGRDYRCIDGQWKLSPLKFDWNSQQWGFCPQESQCFVLESGKAEHTAQSFYNGEYPICVNNTEYIFDNYCNQGNWTSRTKFLATKLLEVAENDEYVLYCSPYREALVDLGNNENYLGGEFLVTQQQQQTLGQSLQPAQPQVLPTCFKDIKLEGKRLVPDSQNTCVNNVCVLKYKEGGEFRVAFATTLNREIDDPASFLISLNIPQEELSQVCQSTGSDFVECNLQGLEFPTTVDLYHSDELNAIIFAQDGIQLEPGVIDKISKWFKNLFGSGLLAEKTFVTQAQNFRNVYIANVDGKKVRAVEEIFPGVKQTLVAEYQNFDTPICDYVKNIKVPPELETELLEKASGIEKVHCAVNDTIQKVVVNAGLDFFWPQLTGKLRIRDN